MGKITAKIMRDAKGARKMGDGGVSGGGLSGADFGFGKGGTPSGEGRGTDQPGSNIDLSGEAPGSTPGGLDLSTSGMTVSDIASGASKGGSETGPAPGPGGSYGGGVGAEAIPAPKAWEATAEKAAAKGERQAEITRKKRRRSLLTEEEGGVLKTAPIYRRTILGR